MNEKQTIAILFGGKSVEHDISINSAKNVYQFLDKDIYTPLLIGISKSGKWFLKSEIDNNFNSSDELMLSLNPDKKGFYNLNNSEFLIPDVIFPVLHGTDGEDGSIQGMLKAVGIPFVGTGVLGSAISMNKLYSKRLLESAGIPVSKYISYEYSNKETIDFNHLKSTLGIPFMAKAANLGSSVGVHKVNSEEKFQSIVEDVFKFDNTIIFEQFIKGRELECSVMGNKVPQASLPAEIEISDAYEFYTYEAKYLDPNAVKLHVPAEVSQQVSEQIQALSIQSYQALKCEDFARVDLFLQEDGNILINEINTIPGFTNSSMFPMMWKERGIEFTPLLTQLINMAKERDLQQQRVSKLFENH